MLASIILLISVAFCAQLHSCAAAEFNKLTTGLYYVVRNNKQNGRVCIELIVSELPDDQLRTKLDFKKKVAEGKYEEAKPIEKKLTFNNTTGFYDNDKGSPVMRVADIKIFDGVKQVFLETMDDTLAKWVCLSTDHENQSLDFIDKNCPLGSDGKPYFPVTQNYETCESEGEDSKK